MEVRIVDNSKQVLTAFEQACQNALNAIGSKAEGYAKQACPVDTGRLRNSIAYTTPTTGTGNKAVYIGTNVEYAPYVEFRSVSHRTGRAHFLKDAASTHGEEYKRIATAAMKAI